MFLPYNRISLSIKYLTFPQSPQNTAVFICPPNTSKNLYPPKNTSKFRFPTTPPNSTSGHFALSVFACEKRKKNAELFPLLKLHSQNFFLMSMCYNIFCSDTSELPILFVLKCIFIPSCFFFSFFFGYFMIPLMFPSRQFCCHKILSVGFIFGIFVFFLFSFTT